MTPTLKERLKRMRRIAAKVVLLAALLVIAEVAGQTGETAPRPGPAVAGLLR